MKVKTRRVGNSTVVSIPKKFKVDTGKEYEVLLDEKGRIIYQPVHNDILTSELTPDNVENVKKYIEKIMK